MLQIKREKYCDSLHYLTLGHKKRAALKLPFPADWRQLQCRTEPPDLSIIMLLFWLRLLIPSIHYHLLAL